MGGSPDMAMQQRADATRARILETAWRLMGERDGHRAVSMAEIAKAAGVSRQLVYLHFETRAGLFAAMTRWEDERTGFQQRVYDAVCLPPPDGLEQLVRTWIEYLQIIAPVATTLESAPAGDAGRVAWDQRMNELRGVFRSAVADIDGAGRLAAGWTIDEAADWAWSQAHLTAWRNLVGVRGWSQGAFADRCAATILNELVSEAGARRTTRSRSARRSSPPPERAG
jgi:AcrR family transcriptional regulator